MKNSLKVSEFQADRRCLWEVIPTGSDDLDREKLEAALSVVLKKEPQLFEKNLSLSIQVFSLKVLLTTLHRSRSDLPPHTVYVSSSPTDNLENCSYIHSTKTLHMYHVFLFGFDSYWILLDLIDSYLDLALFPSFEYHFIAANFTTCWSKWAKAHVFFVLFSLSSLASLLSEKSVIAVLTWS